MSSSSSSSSSSSLLLSALLSRCPDVEPVFEALLWPGSALPEPERVESVTALVAELIRSGERSERLSVRLQALIWDQCVPLLKTMSKQEPQSRQLLPAVCALLGLCVGQSSADSLRDLAELALPALSPPEGDGEQLHLDLDVAVEVMAVLLSSQRISESPSLALWSLSCTLSSIKRLSEAQASKVIVRLWFTSLKSSSEERRVDVLQHVWEDLLSWHEREDFAAVTAQALLCLTALSDHLFSTWGQKTPIKDQNCRLKPDPRESRAFFRVIQAGLQHRDGVSRKRALYLLKRCVTLSEELDAAVGVSEPESLFRWIPEQKSVLREFWEDYALLLETLEENQIHVVRPVLNRLDVLVERTAAGAEGGRPVHPSWLLCVYQRMFHSENKAVMKEGVDHLLELRLFQQPGFASASSQFVVGPFMEVLTESSLYHRSAGQAMGECPEIGLKLQRFMVTFFSSLPEEHRGLVLVQLFWRLGSQHWCAVPLLFLSQALSRLSPCPLLTVDGLQVLREALRCTMITHQVLLRGATQCFLLHSTLCLMDVSAVSLDEVFGFLVLFRAEESLCRGSALWRELCDWLLANEGRFSSAEASTTSTLERISAHSSSRLKAFLTVLACSDQTDSIPDPGEAELLARALLLSVDLEWSRKEERKPDDDRLDQLLCPLLDVLRRLSTSVYLPLCKTDKSLQLMLRLLQLLGGCSEAGKENEDEAAAALTRLLLGAVEPVHEFILRRLSGELQELCDVDRAGLYLSVLRELVRTYSAVPSYLSNLQKNFVSRLAVNCMRILSRPPEQTPSVAGQVQRAVSMATLALLCELAQQGLLAPKSDAVRTLCSLADLFYTSSSSSSSLQCFNQPLLKPSAQDTSRSLSSDSRSDDSPVLRDWGRVAARFIRDQWTCLSFLQKVGVPVSPAETTSATEAFQAALEAVSLLPSDLVLPVLDFMSSSLPQVVLYDEALCVEAVGVSWKLVQALSTNAHDFWPALEAFVRLAFHRSVLELADSQSPKLTASIRQVARELVELSQAKSGVMNVLIQHCCQTWLPSDPNKHTDAAIQSAINHLDILAEACVYGPVFRRDQRLIQEVQTYVEQLGESCAANAVVSSENRDDQFPRLCALAFLSRLEPSDGLQRRLMEELVQRLLRKDEEISKSKVRYYSNSMHHRVKNRVWQSLLLLLPRLRPEFVVRCVLVPVCEAGFCSNQASVKYLIEWALILILHQNPSHIRHLWDCFSTEQEKTKTSICTFLSVLVHLDVLLPQLDDKVAQWRRAVEVILLWCFSHNFSVRLYALLALKRVWEMEGLQALAEYQQGGPSALGGLATVVQACLRQAEAMQNTGNAMKNWTRIQEHFFFSAFHPLRDYSAETIFHTFPSLSELADDEWVPVWKFEKLVDFHSSFPLRNPSRELRELQPGDWVQQDRAELEQEERWAEVQKKIAPWRLSVQEQEPQLMAPQRAARLGKLTNALLVVASLIDKPTNLGGLCRTCEIFGASALVLDSLRHVSDRQFQALSVSSELWLPLQEVKPTELTDFLQLKKRDGYCIVGVEQTANSQSLQDYRFPEKTLLLLGNEREGIPANLLQLLDVCVEIPQQGVTRSLNVHVSAALLVWEYTKQHLGVSQDS
ncbi:probable methyltransferase TARBP1 [Pygocentrus nattereri]|uniref:tRNA (guanosine(18)-2'-O)-methyltransferase TARBP1 n=1 Tax=Pygocentrus nattereri TaxID=42514 RepID=A0AAR2LIU4_PYGNA|nr:probable methyltransferase TARBP1 [Pygocentrus nattereri]